MHNLLKSIWYATLTVLVLAAGLGIIILIGNITGAVYALLSPVVGPIAATAVIGTFFFWLTLVLAFYLMNSVTLVKDR